MHPLNLARIFVEDQLRNELPRLAGSVVGQVSAARPA
jgi:hypothetical protein